MHLNDLLKKFIRAERTENWQLHLKTLESMLPYLAASGHDLYTKSVWIYLERMSNLEEEHPDIHESFMRGMHVVRRADRFWAGLSTDLIIEQVLMGSLRASGGLTRDTGFKEYREIHGYFRDLFAVQLIWQCKNSQTHILPQVSNTRKCKYQGKREMRMIVNSW